MTILNLFYVGFVWSETRGWALLQCVLCLSVPRCFVLGGCSLGSWKNMALFRKFFYRKPPEGLLEISERVYGMFFFRFSLLGWPKMTGKGLNIDGVLLNLWLPFDFRVVNSYALVIVVPFDIIRYILCLSLVKYRMFCSWFYMLSSYANRELLIL